MIKFVSWMTILVSQSKTSHIFHFNLRWTLSTLEPVIHPIASQCHGMESLSALMALWKGNPPVTGGFPSHRASIADDFQQPGKYLVISDALTLT